MLVTRMQSLESYCRELELRRGPKFRQVRGLYLLNHTPRQSRYVESILNREKDSKPWAEYTLNKAVLLCDNYPMAQMRRSFANLNSTLRAERLSRDMYAKNLLFTSTDHWNTVVVRVWHARTKNEQTEFDFFKKWMGEGHIVLFLNQQCRKNAKIYESLGSKNWLEY